MNKFQSVIWAEDFATEYSLLADGFKAAGDFSQRGLKLFQTHGHLDPTVVAPEGSDRWQSEQPICECHVDRMGPRATQPRSSTATSSTSGTGAPRCR